MKTAEFHLNPDRGTIRITVTEKHYWGGAAKRTQHTFRKAQFERALREAQITVPWDKARA